MDVFSNVIFGFQVALEPMNLLYCFIGVFIGTLVGVLPGIGPAGSIALLLPSTFRLSPVSGIIMLAGIAVNDSIILVDRINKNKYSGLDLSAHGFGLDPHYRQAWRRYRRLEVAAER